MRLTEGHEVQQASLQQAPVLSADERRHERVLRRAQRSVDELKEQMADVGRLTPDERRRLADDIRVVAQILSPIPKPVADADPAITPLATDESQPGAHAENAQIPSSGDSVSES